MGSISQELRQAVLQAAIQGKLTKKLPEDGDIKTFLKQVTSEIEENKIGKTSCFVIDDSDLTINVPDYWVVVPLKNIVLS